MNHLILGNQSGDVDSIACSLSLAAAFGEEAIPILNFPAKDLSFRQEALFLFELLSIDPKKLYFEEHLQGFIGQAKAGNLGLILVDHNRLAPGQEEWVTFVDQIIDHHQDEKVNYPRLKKSNKWIDKVGSCATLVTEIITREMVLSQSSALLLLAAILLDTGNLTDASKVTLRDSEAADFLKARAGKYLTENFYEELLKKRGDVSHLSPNTLLRKDLKIYTHEEFVYGIASFPHGVEWTANNERVWFPAMKSFLIEKKLHFLMVLEWIGKEKAILAYTPYPEVKAKLLFQEELPISETLSINPHLKLMKLKMPLARKVLHPLLFQKYLD